MRFSIEQRFAADADAVARAYADPALYVALGRAPEALARPRCVGHDVDGDTVELAGPLPVRRELSAAARAVIDPERLTWVERSTHDLARRRTTFTMVPDHYARPVPVPGLVPRSSRPTPAAGAAARATSG